MLDIDLKMDFVKILCDRGMSLILRDIFRHLSEREIFTCRKVSKLWKRVVDQEVVPCWPYEAQVDWRWTNGPVVVTKLDLAERLELEEHPRKVALQEVYPTGKYVFLLITEFERDNDVMLVYKGGWCKFVAEASIPKVEACIKERLGRRGCSKFLWHYDALKIMGGRLLLFGVRKTRYDRCVE